MKRLLLFVFIMLLTVSSVTAWGINPARQRAEHTTAQQFLSVTIENPDRVEGYFRITFKGDLAPYAKYSGPVIYLPATSSEYVVPFTLHLPEELMPGKNKLEVVLQQIPGGSSSSTIASLIVLVADLTVDVPLAGNHITSQLSIGVSDTDDPTPITVSITNKGEAAITFWADVYIKGPTNQEISSWSTEKQVLDYASVGKIATHWKGEKEPGLYYGEIVLHYGDKFQILRQSFVIGKKEVVSDGFSSDRFNLGNIVAVDITLRNKWNDALDDVFAEIFVLSGEGKILQTFETATTSVPSLSKTLVTGYWDTAKLIVGSYTLNVLVHYPEGESQQSYPVVVKLDALEIAGTGQVTGASDSGFTQSSLFIVLMIVLVITNITIILYFTKMKKKKS